MEEERREREEALEREKKLDQRRRFRIPALAILLLVLVLGGLRMGRTSNETQGQPGPIQEALAPDHSASIDLVALGDFMVHAPQLEAARRGEGYDFSPIFTYLEDDLKEADLAMVNLETTLTDGSSGYSTYPVFASPAEVGQDLKEAGIDLVATANNHSFDKGMGGVDSTLDILEEAGLKVVGSTKGAESEPLVVEVGGIKLGLGAYTYGLNGFDSSMLNSDRPGAVSLIDLDKMEEDVKALKDQGAEAILFYLHWGIEYQDQPNQDQTDLAQALFDMGVDAILGSHPHVPQKTDSQVIGEKTHHVVYSMGNFVSNQRAEILGQGVSTETGLMVKLTIERDREGEVAITAFDPQVTWVDKYQDPSGQLTYQVYPVKKALDGQVDIPRLDSVRDRLNQAQDHFDSL